MTLNRRLEIIAQVEHHPSQKGCYAAGLAANRTSTLRSNYFFGSRRRRAEVANVATKGIAHNTNSGQGFGYA
jgi:hypothetical protein